MSACVVLTTLSDVTERERERERERSKLAAVTDVNVHHCHHLMSSFDVVTSADCSQLLTSPSTFQFLMTHLLSYLIGVLPVSITYVIS